MATMRDLLSYRSLVIGEVSTAAAVTTGVNPFVPPDEDAIDLAGFTVAMVEASLECTVVAHVPVWSSLGVEVSLLHSDMKEDFTAVEGSSMKFNITSDAFDANVLTVKVTHLKRFVKVQVSTFNDDPTGADQFAGAINLRVRAMLEKE